ncbi:unnamed protein product [Rodentolepis nana]|uniref:Uncharacterized protein n=1 Tax=Rodentolepis nana TaxID=102285 RepID=A0A0R3TGE4_RODNA|nr:unnamed protein product [Rodentolepis nana]
MCLLKNFLILSSGKLITAELYPTTNDEPKHVVKMARIKFIVTPCWATIFQAKMGQ